MRSRSQGIVRRVFRGVVAMTLAASLMLTGCAQQSATVGPLQERAKSGDYSTSEKTPLARKVEAPAQGAYLGVFHPEVPFDMADLDAYEAKSGRRAAIIMWYQPWDVSGRYQFDKAACVAALRRGAVPMITWEPWDPGGDPNMLSNPAKQPKYSLKKIIDGEFDGYIRTWARQIKSLGGPVMLRPMHEMNGTWYPWSGMANGNTAADYVEAWKHIHDIFAEEGAANVTWVWSINWESRPNTAKNAFRQYYPGDNYVDWTSISGFNWGTTIKGGTWMSFESIYDEPLRYLRSVGKPIVISEMACASDGGDKQAWIRSAYRSMRRHPEIKAVVYYDHDEKRPRDQQDWSIPETGAVQRAYAQSIASDHFLQGPVDELARWSDTLAPSQWVTLQQTPKLY